MYEQSYNPYQRNVDIIKGYFRSPSILVLGILDFVAAIMSIINGIVSADLTKEITEKLIDYYDKYIVTGSDNGLTSISEAMHSSSATATGSSVNIPIGSILTIVAIMMIYLKSRDPQPTSVPSAGFTIFYVFAIIGLVGVSLASLILLGLIAILFLVYSQMASATGLDFDINFADGRESIRFNADLMLVIAIVFAVVFAFLIFWMLFYAINRFRYIKSIRKSMTSVELKRSGAKAFGVYCIISAVFTGMSLLSSVPALFTDKAEMFKAFGFTLSSDIIVPTVVSLITEGVSLAILILQAKIALGYAKYIDEQKTGYKNVEPSETSYEPIGAGVGVGSANTQPNPYAYLAQPRTQDPETNPATANPYQSAADKPAAPAFETTTCPACGAQTDGSAPFCGQCGSKLP